MRPIDETSNLLLSLTAASATWTGEARALGGPAVVEFTGGERSTTELVITHVAADLRRRLAPTSWIVLEELLSTSQPLASADGPLRSSDASVRGLAARLGLDKDTVARAVRRLVDAELITRSTAPRTVTGTFARTAHLIRVPAGLRIVDHHGAPAAPVTPPTADVSPTTSSPDPRARRAVPARTRPTSSPLQLSLLDS